MGSRVQHVFKYKISGVTLKLIMFFKGLLSLR